MSLLSFNSRIHDFDDPIESLVVWLANQNFRTCCPWQAECVSAAATHISLHDHNMPSLHEHDYLYPRDLRTQLTPNATQRTTLIVAGCYVIAIAILW